MLSTGVILHSVGCRLTSNALSPWFYNMQGGIDGVKPKTKQNTLGNIHLLVSQICCLISCGSWDCE